MSKKTNERRYIDIVICLFYDSLIFLSGCGGIILIHWLTSDKKTKREMVEELFFSKKAKQAMKEWSEVNYSNADRALRDWKEKNPNESHLHPKAQELLRILIGAYMIFLESHPKCKTKQSAIRMKEMLDQLKDQVH